MTIPVAVHMLMLRDLTHTNSTAPAEALFSKEELLVLRALSSEKALPSKPQMRHALDVIAQVGGHIKANGPPRSEEHTSELQSRGHLVCRLLLENKKNNNY